MIDISSVLTRDEKTVLQLRRLYAEHGYSQYKMSKFEEYDLYVRNKDFLVSDNIITFTDTDGRLLALKPDVTLSIIKNSKDNPDGLLKAQYNENVYRISGGTHSFKELMQAGIECIGCVGDREISEVLYLAAKSLDTISEDNVLVISQLDLVSGLLDSLNVSDETKKKLPLLLSQKNSAGISEALALDGASKEDVSLLISLIEAYGNPKSVLPRLQRFKINEKTSKAIDSLKRITDSLTDMGIKKLSIDFSLVGNMKYYNGIAMKGFVNGIPGSIISGGQYDKLMHSMGRKSGAIGFAVYLDELDRLPSSDEDGEVRR